MPQGERDEARRDDVPLDVRPGRRSACMEASKADERARIRAMTPLQRMELALALGRRRVDLMALRAGKGPTP